MKCLRALDLGLLLFLGGESARAADVPSPASVLQQLREAIGPVPWNPAAGYSLTGSFTLKLAGDEAVYDATLLRREGRWAADFRHRDPSRNVRFVAADVCWAATPELTARIERDRLPFPAEYDFPGLWTELQTILSAAGSDPAVRIESSANELYVRGRLRGGEEATFLVNGVRWLPRKVLIGTKPGRPSWTWPMLRPDRSAALIPVPAATPERFEIWFSDFERGAGFVYPKRTDFVGAEGVTATFLMEKGASDALPDRLFDPPGRTPSLALLSYRRGKERSLYLAEGETESFRVRLRSPAWAEWRRANAAVAGWSLAALPLSHLSPATATPAMLGLTIAVLAGGFVFVRMRARAQSEKGGVRSLLVFVGFCGVVLLTGTASMQFGSTRGRSLTAVHAAIRYRVTGSGMYARFADRLLRDLRGERGPSDMTVLADSCGDYAAAYDLVRTALSPARRAEVERALFDFASPLYSALTGWRSNTPEAPALASGLGLAGLAIGCEEFVTVARSVAGKSLDSLFERGLCRAGPGAAALDRLADLFFALEHAGEGGDYGGPALRESVETLVRLMSPAGTLPLFGETAPDDWPRAVAFLMKAASSMPDPLRGRCLEAAHAYWERGRYLPQGFAKLSSRYVAPLAFFVADPALLFQHDASIATEPLDGAGAVLGGGRAAVLRSGTGPDALYLAINAGRSLWTGRGKDVLSFDLYGYSGLLLHGPGHPAPGKEGDEESFGTAASNSFTFDDAGQSAGDSSGVSVALINQRLFDYVRVLADTAYDDGQVQREAILVRPEGETPGYFVLIDEVHANAPAARVASYLHGRGELTRGVDQVAHWAVPPLLPPAFRQRPLSLLAWTPEAGEFGSVRGKLSARGGSGVDSEALVMRWTGSKRRATVLYPEAAGMRDPKMDALAGSRIARVGEADWIGMGEASRRLGAGPLAYVAECVVARERGREYPGLLVISGLEARMGAHSIVSSKPLTASLDGLSGTLLTSRPETEVEIRSPGIAAADAFLLDAAPVAPQAAGVLRLHLSAPGPHTLQPKPAY